MNGPVRIPSRAERLPEPEPGIVGRLGNLLFWLIRLAVGIWLAFAWITWGYDGAQGHSVQDRLLVALVPALVLYGLGWALRYILVGKRGLW